MTDLQRFTKSITAADQVAMRGKIRLRITGFYQQRVVAIEDILRTIDVLPGFHLEGLQEIAFEPWATPGAFSDTYVPQGVRSRVRGEFIQTQRRIVIYALYQTDPDALQTRVPEKHAFMRDWVFSGRPETKKERGIFSAG